MESMRARVRTNLMVSAVRNIPLDERVGALILNLCERNVDAIAAIRGLIATAPILGQNLDQNNRRCCAMALREVATEVEAEGIKIK